MKKRDKTQKKNRNRRRVARSLRDNHSPKQRVIALRMDRLETEIAELRKLSSFTAWFYSTPRAVIRSRQQMKIFKEQYGKQ